MVQKLFCVLKKDNIYFTIQGPPQVSTFVRSDSESFPDELSNVVRQKEEKPSSELIKPSESSTEKKDDNEDEDEDTNDAPGFAGFLQLLQAMSGGAISIPSTGDNGDGIQGLLARLGIVTR
jgi:hypothetical protein